MRVFFEKRWRALVPRGSGWLELFTTPTSLAFVICAIATIFGKAHVLRELRAVSAWPVALLWASSGDLLVYLGAAALFSAGERRVRWIRAATIPLALASMAFALVNACYLVETGQQLTWSAVVLGFERFADLWAIAEELASNMAGTVIVLVLAAIALPCALAFRLRGRPAVVRATDRVRAASLLAVFGALLGVVLPSPSSLAAERVGGNAALSTYAAWIADNAEPALAAASSTFEGYDPHYLVRQSELESFARRADRPNVVIVVLESTRWDHTSLAPESIRRGRPTVQLEKLAARGTVATHARAIMPHTSKSLFSILCARHPTLERTIAEYSYQFRAQCLPEILTRAGYRSKFFQSSWGTFEERPRLVQKLGYADFAAWEDIQGESLGYLASDDLSIPAAVGRWLDNDVSGDEPFLVTVLTSASHHPYRLPRAIAAKAAERGLPTETEQQRYSLLVEGGDAMVGELLQALEQRGHGDDTIIVVLGDHGEGFGDKGVRQHDNNFFEEGLRVPLVFAGPGIPRGIVDANVTLGDVTPTVLARLGLAIAPEVKDTVIGLDILDGPIPERDLPFVCWFDDLCYGFVRGNQKIVHLPIDRRAMMFDLAADPLETRPKPLEAEHHEPLAKIAETVLRHRTGKPWPLMLGPLDYRNWHCKVGAPCKHPNQAAPR